MLKFFLFFFTVIPFFANGYSVIGSGTRQDSEFPVIYWAWAISVYVANDKNPCYQVSNCYIIYGEQFTENTFSSYVRYPTNKSASAYAELGMFLSNGNFWFSGKKYNIVTATVPDGKKYPCVNLGYQIGSSSPVPIYIAECTGGPGGTTPPPVTCQVNTSAIALQHPALMENELNGNRKEVNVNVSCSRNSSVNFRMTGLSGNGRLALDPNGGLSSALTINNVSAQSGVTVTNVGTGGKNITLASTLVSSGEVSFGKYSASAVLQLTIP
jgi:hypothetical protein